MEPSECVCLASTRELRRLSLQALSSRAPRALATSTTAVRYWITGHDTGLQRSGVGSWVGLVWRPGRPPISSAFAQVRARLRSRHARAPGRRHPHAGCSPRHAKDWPLQGLPTRNLSVSRQQSVSRRVSLVRHSGSAPPLVDATRPRCAESPQRICSLDDR